MSRSCAYCSSSIDDGDVFCQNCGRKAADANGQGAAVEAAEPVVAAVPPAGSRRGRPQRPPAARPR
jgi:hypothetical protein